jgi:hypothetical protein
MKDITLLIHGPVSIYTILSLYRHRDAYPIVLVIPKPHDESTIVLLNEIQRIANEVGYKINYVVYDVEVNDEYDNGQNRYLHFFSVSLGLELCNTMYTIKLRSDEFYSKLDPFVDSLKTHEHKIVTNDVFFRKRTCYPIHPSDHLVGGKTMLLKRVFSLAKEYCIDATLLKSNPFTTTALLKVKDVRHLAAEQILGLASVVAVSEDRKFDMLDEPDVDVAIVKQSFEIVTSDKLGFFRIGTNSLKTKEYFERSYFNETDDIDNILDYKIGEVE